MKAGVTKLADVFALWEQNMAVMKRSLEFFTSLFQNCERMVGVRSSAGAKDFSSNLCVQTGSGAHPASCPMDTGGPFPGGKSAAGA
jgi:hypothetical protein